jgi:deoxyribose-phosphate aldolase
MNRCGADSPLPSAVPAETQRAVPEGAAEIDVVVNIGKVKTRRPA